MTHHATRSEVGVLRLGPRPPARLGLPPHRLDAPQLGVLVLVCVLGLLVACPLALIILNSFNTAQIGQPAVYSTAAWSQAWTDPGVLTALWNTLQVAFWYQLISFPVAIGLAWILARTNIPWSRGFEFFFWVSFFIPALSSTLGWILLIDPQVGLLNQWLVRLLGLSAGPFNAYSFWGIIWVHLASHAVSAKVMLLTPAFRNMDAGMEEAGRMSGANAFTTMLRVTLPVMTPALVIVFMLGLVRIFESFEIERLLGVPFGFFVYSTRIVNYVAAEPPQLAPASALGTLTLALLLVAAPIQRRLTTRRSYTTITSRMRATPMDLGPWRWVAFALMLLVGLVLVAVPLASLVAGSLMTRFGYFTLAQVWTLNHWQQILRDTAFTRSLTNSLTVSLAAAVIAPTVFSIVAYVIVRARSLRGNRLLDLIVWVPSVVPGALAGLGLLWMFLGVPFFHPLYGSMVLLVLAVLLGGMTLSTQVLKAALLQLGKELEEGGRVSGAGWLTTYVRIVLPVLAPTLLLVGTLSFLVAAYATSSIIMLATSNTQTLSLLTLAYVSQGLRESATVVAVLITALTTGVAMAARLFGLNVGLRTSANRWR